MVGLHLLICILCNTKIKIYVLFQKPNEDIEMAQVNTPSRTGGIFFAYSIDEHGNVKEPHTGETEYVPIHRIDKQHLAEDKNVLPKSLEPLCVVQEGRQGPPRNVDGTEETENEASSATTVQRSFRAPTEDEYDINNYSLARHEASGGRKGAIPARKTKKKNPCCTENGKMSDAMNIWASVGVLLLILGAIFLFTFVPRSEEEKPSDDEGKLFSMIQAILYKIYNHHLSIGDN